MRWTARRGAWLAVGLGAIAAAAVSRATIPAADGTISGCYARKSGKLRVVDGTPCKRSEEAVTWSQTGPQGPTGGTGPAGAETRIFGFIQVWQCCGGSGSLLDPPQVRHAVGITSAGRLGAGQYVVTLDRDVTNCTAHASIASDDAATPSAGSIAVGRPSGLPANQFQISTRASGGAFTDLGSTGGTYGFTLAVFCP
jgi:hypothetical protein